MKATVEGSKKPRHFLDYLFLAVHREQQMRLEHPEMNFSRFSTLPREDDASSPHREPIDAKPRHEKKAKAAKPSAPKNAEQIFRRGKQLSNLKMPDALQQARERELLAAAAPNGIDTPSPDHFDREEDLVAVDENMFDVTSHSPAKVVSFTEI